MASKVQIAKLALQHVGDRYDISDITEATPEAEQVNLLSGGAMRSIEELKPGSFDLVIVDPPFDSNLGGLVLERLVNSACVRRGGFVYIESPASTQIPPPQDWSVWRDQ